MYKPFSEWDYNRALQELGKRQKEGDKESLAYVVEKDNWQDGSGWSGPQITGNDPSTNVIKEGINRDFTPKGAIPSVVRRHRRGVVGREPGWVISLRRPLKKVTNKEGELVDETPTVKEQALIDEANKLLLDWWNQQRGLREFRKAVTYYTTVGRGPLRLYWPPGALQNGRMPQLSFEEAVKKIYLLAPKPEEAVVVTDTWDMRKAGVYTFDDREGKPTIGLCYVNGAGKTVIKTLKSGSSNTAQAPGLVQRVKDYIAGEQPDVELELNGNLLLFEMDGEALITEPVKRQQKLLDKALTMLSHNMDEAGFRQEIYYNMMPPGKTVKIPDPENPSRTIDAFIQGPSSSLPKGAGAIVLAQGTSWTDENKSTGEKTTHLATPRHEVVDPIPVTSFADTAKVAHQNILEDTDQLHVQIAGDADSSGESRKQARDDYKKSLDETGSEVDYVGSSVAETFLALVAILARKPGYFNELRVNFQCRIDPGPLSSEDRRINIEEMKAEVKTHEEAIQYAGATDPDAVLSRLAQEKKERAKNQAELPMPPPIGKPANGDSELVQ